MNIQAPQVPSKEWCPVLVLNGSQLRTTEPNVNTLICWWNSHGEQTQVKGRVGLQNFSGTPLFQIVYDGIHINNGNSLGNRVRGTLYLPLEIKDDGSEILTSRHACAHGIHLSFAPGNADGL